jgi:hypothetical protein
MKTENYKISVNENIQKVDYQKSKNFNGRKVMNSRHILIKDTE